jgi:hypothetical protein
MCNDPSLSCEDHESEDYENNRVHKFLLLFYGLGMIFALGCAWSDFSVRAMLLVMIASLSAYEIGLIISKMKKEGGE